MILCKFNTLLRVFIFGLAFWAISFNALAVKNNLIFANVPDGEMITISLPNGAIYEGPVVSKLFEGKGKLTWRNGDKFEGEFYQGQMNGQGELNTNTGDKYVGEFKNGSPHGVGEWIYHNGDSYKGDMAEGDFHGKGVYKNSNGEIYQVEFVKGNATGYGTVTWPNGNEYQGDILDWYAHGEGKLTKVGKETYTGGFKFGNYHGNGLLLYSSGNSYQGEFSQGQFHGIGEFKDVRGVTHKGEFVRGFQRGNGEIIYSNGDHYKGDVKNWNPTGKGILTMTNGSRYIGDITKGVFDGKGEFYFKNGDHYIGTFKAGYFHGNGEYYYATPKGRKPSYKGVWDEGNLLEKDGEKLQQVIVEEDKFYVEESLYQQSTLVNLALNNLEQGKLGSPELYFLSFGAFGDQDVFMKEAIFSKQVFEQHFDTRGKSLSLVNNRKTINDFPMATVGNLKRVLEKMSHKMNVEEDILFLYITSHGSKKYGVTVNFGGVYLHDLSVSSLATSLKESNIKWKVIVVSACYSGQFVDELKDDHTMVMTSSQADHVSFGCSDSADFTFFGRAFFEKAITKQKSFKSAFVEAKNVVYQWEEEEGFDHSIPQLASTDKIEKQLHLWRQSLKN